MDYDPRIVALYDEDNPDGPDHDFYRSFAADASRIIDLGCGTGLLTVTLVDGRTGPERPAIVGIDPSSAMLDYARARPGAEKVTWVEGDSRDIPLRDVDFACMTGNVAQHIPDSDWRRTLMDLRTSMAVGGVLAFESRNPAARAWESWSAAGKSSRMTGRGELVEWAEIAADDDRVVHMTSHNHFPETGKTITEALTLVFRSREEIESDLDHAGFAVETVSSDWAGEQFDPQAPIMVFVARAR